MYSTKPAKEVAFLGSKVRVRLPVAYDSARVATDALPATADWTLLMIDDWDGEPLAAIVALMRPVS